MRSGLEPGGDASQRRLIVKFHGGLGNQIFQYAAGLYFSRRTSIPLEIVRPVERLVDRQATFPRLFQMDAFSIDAKARPAARVDRLFLSLNPRLRFLCGELERVSGRQSIEEPAYFRFFPDLIDQAHAQTIYLIGHWQAAEYVEAVADPLRSSLRLRNPPRQRNLDYAEAIRALPRPVSLHIRLGDYAVHFAAATKGPAKTSWALKRSYFREAVARMRSLFPDASFVVFSDDQKAAREIMSGEPVSLWVEGNDTSNAYEDLWLMSCCKHHIIANSTFSWWGAWLNPSPDKAVLAPKYWLNTHHSYFPDLCPPSWTLLDNLA